MAGRRDVYRRADNAKGHAAIRKSWRELEGDNSGHAESLRNTLREREQLERDRIPLRALNAWLDKTER